MVEGRDRVVLADLGLVKAAGTPVGKGIGSILYIAPEAFRSGPVLPSRDIWALGITLFNILSGKSPFDRPTTRETRHAIRHHPVPMQALPCTAAEGAVALVGTLLEKDPALWPSAGELLEANAFVLSGAPRNPLSVVCQNTL